MGVSEVVGLASLFFCGWWPSHAIGLCCFTGLGFPQAVYMRPVAMKDAAIGDLVSVYPMAAWKPEMKRNTQCCRSPKSKNPSPTGL